MGRSLKPLRIIMTKIEPRTRKCTHATERENPMKAVIRNNYGTYEGLEYADVEKPSPGPGEALIRNHASSINSHDIRRLAGKPALTRLREGYLIPENKLLGADVAGVIEELGEGETDFEVGDEVFCCVAGGYGDNAFAEYVCAKRSTIVKKPANITFEQAAAVPMAAVTALQGLRNYGQVSEGMQVLINGASGGVGTFAVQIAKALGAEVTGVCSGKNLEMVKSIGADHVINYEEENFAKESNKYDLMLDIAANQSMAARTYPLKPGGLCVVIGYATTLALLQVALSRSKANKDGGKDLVMLLADQSIKGDLQTMAEFLEEGKVVPVIDHCYPLSEAKDAFRYFLEEHAKGKVVLSIP